MAESDLFLKPWFIVLSLRADKSLVKVKMVELTARVRVFDEQWLTTPGDLQEGAGGQRSTVL